MKFHGQHQPRGLATVRRSPSYEGRFGRLFRALPPYEPSNAAIDSLTSLMKEAEGADGDAGWGSRAKPSPFEHPGALPAGYTYFGQFIDHDLTFDPTSQLGRENDPDEVQNFRTPRFDLDSVYGTGPHGQPHLYDNFRLRHFSDNGHDDLLRIRNDEQERATAIIGDPRNDENAIVGQLHLAFIKAHNRAQGEVEDQVGLPPEEAFFEARRVCRWHYQYLAVHDFLERLVGADVLGEVLNRDADGFPLFSFRHYDPKYRAFMPVEFSVAAYRFGHSLIRPSYRLRSGTEPIPVFVPEPEPSATDDLRGFGPLHPELALDWRMFFDRLGGDGFQLARRIDDKLSTGVTGLPFEGGESLARLNLERGRALGLPSGQSVAAAMCVSRLENDELGINSLDADVRNEVRNNTPLWFHILREADTRGGGKRLGPVGARIVAEVIIGLIKLDPLSYLHVDPCWNPSREKSLKNRIHDDKDEPFTMGHFLAWAT